MFPAEITTTPIIITNNSEIARDYKTSNRQFRAIGEVENYSSEGYATSGVVVRAIGATEYHRILIYKCDVLGSVFNTVFRVLDPGVPAIMAVGKALQYAMGLGDITLRITSLYRYADSNLEGKIPLL